MFINEERGNLEVVVECLLEILTKRRSQMFSRPTDRNAVKNTVRELISSLSKWNIVNEFDGKYDFLLGQIF